MYLEDLYVTFIYRGKHIGSKLLKSVAKVYSMKLENHLLIIFQYRSCVAVLCIHIHFLYRKQQITTAAD